MAQLAATTRLFLTGASGFVGRAVCRVAQGVDGLVPIAVARDADGGALRAQLAKGDAPALLLHLAWPALGRAASTARAAAEAGQGEDFERFRAWTLSLAAAAAEAGAHFVGVGTGIEAHLGDPGAMGPAYAAYARRKQALHDALDALGAGPRSWVRLHFLFGPGESPTRFVPAAIGACHSGQPLRCGSPERRRHWLHVDDVAALLCAFVQAPEPGTWDLTGPSALSFEALIALVEEAVGKPLRRAPDPLPTADAALSYVAPAHLWPGVPGGLGSPAQVGRRLGEYARELTARGGVC